MASSRLTISRTQIFSAAVRIVPAPNDLAYQKYDTQTTQKGYPIGVQFYSCNTKGFPWCLYIELLQTLQVSTRTNVLLVVTQI